MKTENSVWRKYCPRLLDTNFPYFYVVLVFYLKAKYNNIITIVIHLKQEVHNDENSYGK